MMVLSTSDMGSIYIVIKAGTSGLTIIHIVQTLVRILGIIHHQGTPQTVTVLS